jgi:ubiquitin C-terminal hydrolase
MKGLENIGNTCSINTLIQCFGHVSAIRNALFSLPKPKNLKKRWCLSAELCSLLEDLWTRKKDMRPERFVAIFHEALSGIIERGQQHDICELTVYLCDAILEEYGDPGHPHSLPTPTADASPAYEALAEKVAKSWERFHPGGFSQWNGIFEGLQVSQVQCGKCGYACHSYEPFSQVTLELTGPTLPECLHQLFCTEQLTEWRCDKCKAVQTAHRVVRFWTLPRVLIISLKRFTYSSKKGTMQKVTSPIKITEHITFMPKSIIGPGTNTAQSFKLASVALHHGSAHFGHYTAVCRRPDNVWAQYDDMDVHVLSEPNLVLENNRDAYLLVYERL